MAFRFIGPAREENVCLAAQITKMGLQFFLAICKIIAKCQKSALNKMI